MNILHVIHNLSPVSGGPVTYCVELGAALARRGHRVRIAATDWDAGRASGGGKFAHPDDSDLEIVLYRSRGGDRWPVSWEMWRRLPRLVASSDVVHCHSLYHFHGLVTWRACRRFRVPFLLRPHGALMPYNLSRSRAAKSVASWVFQDRALSAASGIHYTSEYERDQSLSAVSARYKAIVVPAGVKVPEYRSRPHESRKILFLGRLNHSKGLDLLASAFAGILKSHDDAQLYVVGPDGGSQSSFENSIRMAGCRESVTIKGLVRGDERDALFAAAGLFVMPSHSESFGIAIIEAMAAGLPVVVSKRAALSGLIRESGAGWVSEHSVDGLSRTMSVAMGDPGERLRRGLIARRVAGDRFGWSTVSASMEKIYEEIAAGRPCSQDARRPLTGNDGGACES